MYQEEYQDSLSSEIVLKYTLLLFAFARVHLHKNVGCNHPVATF